MKTYSELENLARELKNEENRMKLADLKRLEVGTALKLIYSRHPGHKFLNLVRVIERKNTTGIMFEGSSWLEYPKAAYFSSNNDNIFSVLEDKGLDEKLYEYFIPRIRSEMYPITEERQHTADYLIATDSLKRYKIPAKEANDARERLEKIEEKVILLTYEIMK